MAGQGQEHVVQGWPVQSDVVQPDTPLVQLPQGLGEPPGAPVTGAVSERLWGSVTTCPDARIDNTSAADSSWVRSDTVSSSRSPPT